MSIINKFENFSPIRNDIEDIMLIFVEEGRCVVSGNDNLLQYKFVGHSFERSKYISMVISKLNRNNINNYFYDDSSIFFYSSALELMIVSILDECKTRESDYGRRGHSVQFIVWESSMGKILQDMILKVIKIEFKIMDLLSFKFKLDYSQLFAIFAKVFKEKFNIEGYSYEAAYALRY